MDENVVSIKEDSKDIVSLKEYTNLKFELLNSNVVHAREISDLKQVHADEISKLRWELSSVAINKAENSMNERMEASNNKYALLKEQNSTFQTQISSLPTSKDFESLVKQVSILTKLVYIGVGGVLLLELIMKFLGK
jgi:hypothetical protein